MTVFIVVGLFGFFSWVAYENLREVARTKHARRISEWRERG